MKSRLTTQLATDIPYWVAKDTFLSRFDMDDFACRDVGNVVDAYLADWFETDSSRERRFRIPPVSVHGGSTQFIGGRHRTAVLLKHLDAIPLSFDTRDMSHSDNAWVCSVVSSRIDLSLEIDLPDLPIRERLP